VDSPRLVVFETWVASAVAVTAVKHGRPDRELQKSNAILCQKSATRLGLSPKFPSYCGMAKRCLFCPRTVDSAEHVWSDWILEDLKPVQPIHIRIGKTISKWVDNPEVRVKNVCQKCNNGWMSDIENENKPHMLAMMNDEPTVLAPKQQKLLTRWAILKAIVIDGSSKSRIPFYSESERTGVKPPARSIPVGTFAWIGRLSVKAFHAGLTDTFGAINNVPKAFHGCVTTITVGHLAIQVITMHVLPMFATTHLGPAYKPGAWDLNLLDIWPVFDEEHWPPRFSFELKGSTHHIAGLINRWKIGSDITK
jgi:hypothetical protein